MRLFAELQAISAGLPRKRKAQGTKRSITNSLLPKGSQGRFRPSFMSIAQELWALEGYRQTLEQPDGAISMV